jgi:hypothetical protein
VQNWILKLAATKPKYRNRLNAVPDLIIRNIRRIYDGKKNSLHIEDCKHVAY